MARKNDLEMHSLHNEGTYIIAERFIRTLKNKIHKYMTSVSKKMCIMIIYMTLSIKKQNISYHN